MANGTAAIWVMTSKELHPTYIKTGTSDGINVEILVDYQKEKKLFII
jgi:hypothetical protein